MSACRGTYSTRALLPRSFFGLLCHIWGVITFLSRVPSSIQVCVRTAAFTRLDCTVVPAQRAGHEHVGDPRLPGLAGEARPAVVPPPEPPGYEHPKGRQPEPLGLGRVHRVRVEERDYHLD